MLAEKFPTVKLLSQILITKDFRKQTIRRLKIHFGIRLVAESDTVVEEDTFWKKCYHSWIPIPMLEVWSKMIDGTGRFLPESKRGLPTPAVAFYKIFGLSALFPKSKTFGKYHLGYLERMKINSVDVLAGAFMLIRKNADKIDCWTKIFSCMEKTLICHTELSKAAIRIIISETRIIHYKGESTKEQCQLCFCVLQRDDHFRA